MNKWLRPYRNVGIADFAIVALATTAELEKWVLKYWNIGLMVKFVLTMKLTMDNILKKVTIPSFHYSIIP